jgi:hypothetical protein
MNLTPPYQGAAKEQIMQELAWISESLDLIWAHLALGGSIDADSAANISGIWTDVSALFDAVLDPENNNIDIDRLRYALGEARESGRGRP